MRVSKLIPSTKFIIAFLSVSLCGGMFFSYNLYQNFAQTKKILSNEKNIVINELKKSKDSLELAILNNTSIKTDLIIERQKVNNLLNEINNSNIDIASLIKYKSEVSRLKGVVASLTKEKFELKKKNEVLKVQRDSTILVLSNAKRYNDTLLNLNEDLNKVIKKGSKISIVNLQTDTMKQLRTGDLEPTDKAKKVEVIQVSFLVVGNKIIKPCHKEYYIQIIDSQNNIVGKKLTKNYGSMILDYSFMSTVKFKNETVEVISDLEIKDLKKGTYFVNIFDKGELASKTSFTLR